MEQAERREQLERARRQNFAALGFSDDEIDLAIKGNLSEDDLFARRAEAERDAAERQKREAREAAKLKERAAHLRAERESPEYRERVRCAAEEEERQLIVAALAMWLEMRGDAAARDAGVCREAIKQGFASKTNEPGEVLSIDEARIFYCDVVGLMGASGENLLDRIREEVDLFRNDLVRISHDVAVAEYHAADGDTNAFEHALRLRVGYSGYPDLVILPVPRIDLSKKQRGQLLRANEYSAHGLK